MLFLPVLVVTGNLGLHGGGTGFPLGGADFTVLVGVLEGLDESEDFFDVPADGEVVVGSVSEDTVGVNDEGGSAGHTSVGTSGDEGSVDSGDSLGDIGKERDLELSESTLVSGLLAVLEVGEMGVNGGSDD